MNSDNFITQICYKCGKMFKPWGCDVCFECRTEEYIKAGVLGKKGRNDKVSHPNFSEDDLISLIKPVAGKLFKVDRG